MKSKKIYLAIPYTGHEEISFKLANQVAGALINRGDIPMSPISHSHPISEECEVRGDWEFWKEMDCSFIDWADEVLVISFDEELVLKSVGVQAEIKHAKETGKPVKYMKAIRDVDGNYELEF